MVLGLLICNVGFADVAGRYKAGKGPLKISKEVADLLEYYFSGGKIGRYAKKQKESWIGELIAISADGKHYSWFNTPTSYQNNVAPGHYTGQAIKGCKKKSGQECFLFASRNRIVWDNGSDKKKRRLKRKDIRAGKTLQILQELGFYDGDTTQKKKINRPLKNQSKKIEKPTQKNKLISNVITEQLTKLNELYKSGVLTKEEFTKAKTKLLN